MNLLSFGVTMIAHAKHISEIERLRVVVNNPELNIPFKLIPALGEFFLENLIDTIRISICFENYMKAKLLLNGFLVLGS